MKTMFALLLILPSLAFADGYKCDVTLGTNDQTTKSLVNLPVAEKSAYKSQDGVLIPNTILKIDIQIYKTGSSQAVNVILIDTKTQESASVAYASESLGSEFSVAGAKMRGQGFAVNCRK